MKNTRNLFASVPPRWPQVELPNVHSRGSNFSKLERGELWTGAFLFSLRGGTKKIELRLLTNRLYSFFSFTRTHTHTQRQQNRIPKYRFVKLCLIYYLISPRFKGAVTLYKSGIAPIFRKLSPSIDKTGDLIMKGDFQAVRKELGPQLKELQSFVQKDGPEAVNRLLSKVKNTKPAAGGSPYAPAIPANCSAPWGGIGYTWRPMAKSQSSIGQNRKKPDCAI